MKAISVGTKLFLLVFTISIFTIDEAKAIQINIYGKSGMEISNGSVKVCPGWAFNKCASIEFTLSELVDYIFSKDASKMPICQVIIFNENGEITKETFLKIRNIEPSLLDNLPSEIKGESIEFE